jgi:hypothetical protein
MQSKTMKVKVRATETPAGDIEFDIDGVKASQSRINLRKDGGAHAINFALKDSTGKGLQFDTRDPIWVGEDCPCPPPRGINSDQLRVTDCEPKRLSTVDQNCGRARDLRYQLNFTTADGSRATCDPVIKNGGGTI